MTTNTTTKNVLRIAAVCLAALLFCGVFCGAAVAESGDSGGIHWELDDAGNLNITGNGEIPEGAFRMNQNITTVQIGSGITSIGDRAFYGCSSLTSITLPLGVETIGEAAFACLRSVEELCLYLPETLEEIGSHAFADMPIDIIIFQGGKCNIADDAFSDVTATAAIVYGTGWSEEDKLDYGGNLSYETWYVFESEDVYDNDSYGSSYILVPYGEFEYFNSQSDYVLVDFEVLEGTVPEDIDFTEPEVRFTMTDNVKVRFTYEYVGEDDPIDDPDDDGDDDDYGFLLERLFGGFLSAITGVSRTVFAVINMILRVFNIYFSFEIRFF